MRRWLRHALLAAASLLPAAACAQQQIAYLSDLAPGLKMRGAYSAAATYAANDVVTLNGTAYYALQAAIGQNPATATAYWSALSPSVLPAAAYGHLVAQPVTDVQGCATGNSRLGLSSNSVSLQFPNTGSMPWLLAAINTFPAFANRITWHWGGAVPGSTSTQALANYDAQCAPYKPNGTTILKTYDYLLGWTNDNGQGISNATTISNINALLAKDKANGITSVVGTEWYNPTGSTPAQQVDFDQVVNGYIRGLASLGVIVVDMNAVVGYLPTAQAVSSGLFLTPGTSGTQHFNNGPSGDGTGINGSYLHAAEFVHSVGPIDGIGAPHVPFITRMSYAGFPTAATGPCGNYPGVQTYGTDGTSSTCNGSSWVLASSTAASSGSGEINDSFANSNGLTLSNGSVSNGLFSSAAAGTGQMIYTGSNFANDQCSIGTVGPTYSIWAGALVRTRSSDFSGYRAFGQNSGGQTQWQIYRIDGASATNLAAPITTGNVAQGDVIKFCVAGTTPSLTLFKNGTQIGTAAVDNAASPYTSGFPGLVVQSTTASFSNFQTIGKQ